MKKPKYVVGMLLLVILSHTSDAAGTFRQQVDQTTEVYQNCLQQALRESCIAPASNEAESAKQCRVDTQCKTRLYSCLADALSKPAFHDNRYARTFLGSIRRLMKV